MSPTRRRRLGRTAAGLAVATAFLSGRATRLDDWVLATVLVVVAAFSVAFQTFLLWCLDTANHERNVAVTERDTAYAARDTVFADAQGLVEQSAEVVEISRQILAGREGLLSGEPSEVAKIVAEARRRGVDVDYVSVDDLRTL